MLPPLPPGISIDVVTAAHVWHDTSGMTPEEIMREISYEIAVGSGIKFSKQAEQQSVDYLLQTLLPVVAGAGDYNGINGLLNLHYKAHDIPEDERFILQPPPPPPEGAAPGEEKSESSEGKKSKGGKK
jgi:hypothetical protein